MPRDHARILTAIWADDEFVALPGSAQRMYLVLLTQPGLTYAGVQDLRVTRWASRACDTGPDAVWAALNVLEDTRFVVVDEATEEVLVRSYLRVNEVWKQPKLLTLALRQTASVQSRRLRYALREELLRLPDDSRADPARTLAVTLPDTPGDTPGDTPARSHRNTHAGTHAGTHADTPPDSPAGTPVETLRAHTGARVTRNLEQEPHLSRTTSRGDLTEVDADARSDDNAQPAAVPDTPPAPLEAPTETDSPPAPIHANAMPPARCRNHLELADPPPCGRCADARRTQEQWIAERDATVAEARAQVAAELAEARRLERQQIDACDYCDSRGVTPGGVRCTHDADVDRTSPGRAEWRTARRALAERPSVKAKAPTDDKAATGQQLTKLAVLFGERGVNDRDNRLTVVGEVIGRPITSTRELTRAEASVLIDRFENPTPPEPPQDDDPDVGVLDMASGGMSEGELELDVTDVGDPLDDDEPIYSYAGGPDEPPF